jgi:TPR repeat protein
LIVWGNYNIIEAQVHHSPKPKQSYTNKKSTVSFTTSKKRKASKSYSSKRLTSSESGLINQKNISELSINKAKEFYHSSFVLQAFRLLEPHQNSKEMDAEAFAILGECLRSIGSGISTDYKKAEQNFIKSLSINPSKEVLLSLGQIYQLGGYNLARNTDKAILYFQQAADMNVPIAKFELGRLYFQGLPDSLQDEKKGISLLEEAANQDVSGAQWMLGSLYAKGYNNEKSDMVKAKFWFKKYKDNPIVKQNSKL